MNTVFRFLLKLFVVLAAFAGTISFAHAQQCAAADFNRDGRSDVFWLHATSTLTYEWQMNGAAISASGVPASTGGDTGWQVKGIGDFDGDGKSDVLFRHASTGAITIWLMNGTTVASSGNPGTVGDLGWQIQGVGDFDGDGKADILWMHTDGSVDVWFMNGTTNTGSGFPAVLGPASGWAVQGIGDFNGDGKADILWKHSSGTVVIWMMNGATIASSSAVTNVGPDTATGWRVMGVGDFNGDGKADILWRNDDLGGIIYAWLMNGTTISSAAAVTGVGTEAGGGWIVRAIGDYDGDGKADVFWKNDTALGGITYVWLMNSTTISSATAITGVPDTDWKVANIIAPCPAFTPSLVAARTSGVAPLAVFFDASGTVSANPSTVTFHEVEYRWDFGNPAGSPISGTTWANGAQPGVLSRNTATGPVAAHVFEEAGTYIVTLTARDTNGVTATATTTITVTNPDTAFASPNTFCFSKTGNFTGCPAGVLAAQQITDAAGDFDAAINTRMASNRRFLFRAGEAWTASTSARITSNGPGIIGSYGDGGPGTGTPPVVTGNIGDATIQLSSSTTPTIGDWRIMDLEITASNHGSSVGVGTGQSGGGIKQVTLLRMNVHNASHNIEFNPSILDFWNANGHAGHSMYDQMAVVDSTSGVVAGTAGGYGMYTGAKRFMILGNNLNNNGGGEHVLRTPQIINAVISNNTLANQGGGGKHIIKMHGYSADVSGAWNAPSDYNASIVSAENPNYPTSGTYSEKIVISDNKLNATAPSGDASWTVAIGPQDNAHDERVRDVIFERNWMVTSSSAGQQVALITWSSRTTIRNNLIDMSNAAFHNSILSEQRGIDGVGSPAEQWPNFVWVYNNTIYSASTGDFVGLELASGSGHNNSAANVVLKNNLAYAPSSSSPVMVSGSGHVPTIINANNSTNTNIKSTNPTFTTTPPGAPAQWKPTCTGTTYPCTKGTSVPVVTDFFRVDQPATRDLGAVLH